VIAEVAEEVTPVKLIPATVKSYEEEQERPLMVYEEEVVVAVAPLVELVTRYVGLLPVQFRSTVSAPEVKPPKSVGVAEVLVSTAKAVLVVKEEAYAVPSYGLMRRYTEESYVFARSVPASQAMVNVVVPVFVPMFEI
jgi:hypothetical protein